MKGWIEFTRYITNKLGNDYNYLINRDIFEITRTRRVFGSKDEKNYLDYFITKGFDKVYFKWKRKFFIYKSLSIEIRKKRWDDSVNRKEDFGVRLQSWKKNKE